jgi:hypothetical protein
MASATYLSNPGVLINSVNLTDMCTSATVTNTIEALEATAFGSTSRSYVGGLASQEITLDLYMSYAATETFATLSALVGRFELVGCYLEALPVINATMGELSTISITFTGGVLTTVVS